MLTWDDRELARYDDYIHLLFPTHRARAPGHPIVDRYIVSAFRTDPHLRARLRRVFLHMFRFYGFMWVEGGLVRNPRARNMGAGWMRERRHHAYITRMLQSLRVLGLEAEAQALWDALSEPEFVEVFPQASVRAWEASMEIDFVELVGLQGIPEVQGEEVSGIEDLVRKLNKSVPIPAPSSSASTTPSPRLVRSYSATLPSWDTENIPRGLNIRPVFGPAVLPSPLGIHEARWTAWRSTLESRHSPRVMAFYDLVLQYCSPDFRRQHICEAVGRFTRDGRSGLICYLKDNNRRRNITRRNGEETHHDRAAPHFEHVRLPRTLYP